MKTSCYCVFVAGCVCMWVLKREVTHENNLCNYFQKMSMKTPKNESIQLYIYINNAFRDVINYFLFADFLMCFRHVNEK